MSVLSNPTTPGSRSSSGTERTARSPAAPPPLRLSGSWLAAQGRLPLAFMGLALAWLAAAVAMLVARADVLTLPHAAPAVVALTHAWVLGFFLTVAMGAIYQLAPVALSTTLAHERAGWWHLALHAIGVPIMVAAFWNWRLPWIALGGASVAIGVFLFAWNTGVTVFRSGKRDPVAASLLLATAWLVLTVLAGMTLALNRIYWFWPADPVALLRAHAHLGLVGFFLTLLQGVTFRLVPMFTLGDVPHWRPIRLGLWCSQLGLLVLAPALAWHAGYVASAAALAIVVGMGASGTALVQTLAARKKRALDPGVAVFVRGLIGLAAASWLALALCWPKSPWGSAPGGFSAMTYAVVLIGAGLLPAIAGMMCKIVPFLTWMRAYGPQVGRGPTPAAGSLVRPRVERVAFALQTIAVVPLLIGVSALNVSWLRLGASVLALGVALFLFDLLGVLKHLAWPITSTRSAPSKLRS